jgi:hypothetical protein
MTLGGDIAPASTVPAQQTTAPPVGRFDRFVARWRGRFEFCQFVCVIVGVPLLILQLVLAEQQRKVDRTLDFAARFSDEWFGRKRSDLVRPWFAYTEELQALNQAGGATRGVIEKLVRGIVRSESEENPERDLRMTVYEVADFFDQLSFCIEAKRCSKSVAVDYFGGFAKEFYCLYGVIIRDMRQELAMPSIGLGVERLVDPSSCFRRPAGA